MHLGIFGEEMINCPKCGLKGVDSMGWCNSDNCVQSQWTAHELKQFASQQLRAIKYNKQETKMTREEAVKKLLDTGRWSTEKADLQVSSLEALGLIKFDQPVENFIPAYLIGNERVQKLIDNGYRIVKLGKNTTIKLDSCVLVDKNTYNGKLVEIEQ